MRGKSETIQHVCIERCVQSWLSRKWKVGCAYLKLRSNRYEFLLSFRFRSTEPHEQNLTFILKKSPAPTQHIFDCQWTLPPILKVENRPLGWANFGIWSWIPYLLAGYAQPLVHDRARRRVLDMYFLVGLYSLLDRKSGQCCFVKPAEDQFFLPGIKVDVANRIDSRF